MPWFEFILAFAVFFLSHSVPVRPPVKPALQRMLGARGFTGAYSALSLAVLAWLIAATGRAPYVPLWPWAPWQNLVPLGAMLPVCVILALAIGRPNPFSFGGAQNDLFDPTKPGIVRLLRHPLLAALALWAGAHIVPNGDVAHVILFGTFAGFTALGGTLVDQRKRREMGTRWDETRAQMQQAPWLQMPPDRRQLGLRLLMAGALYAVLVALHPVLFGVSPLG